MIIDVECEEEIGSTIEKFVMSLYEYKFLFYIEHGGKQWSTIWNSKDLKTFQPNITVSEFIENTKQGYLSNFVHYMYCADKGIHPLWTSSIEYKPWSEEIATPLTPKGVKATRGHAMDFYKKYITPFTFKLIK